MRLKSISLHGFKSFSTRTEVPLGEGITAIVGPNGCGKSNVSDAIRWVLGEGNVRNLRGENILDVIFKGGGTAKPSGFAEVSLLIDNDDRALPIENTDVSVARRVYRTGGSDFLINNQPCRLKDIRNLFLGTGLGSNGYAVIEREMVDTVLSDRDDQRRLFFEEAAGISRYKLQRKEATRKLEATEQDLIRIDDIVREIEREVRSLARQVGKARKYQRLHDQIRDLEVDLALHRWTHLESRRAACASERDESTSDRERLAGELTRMEAEQETRKIRLMEREEALERARGRREALLQEQATAREEVSVLSTRIQGWESRDAELTRRITEESERATSLRRRIEETRPEADRLRGELARHRSAVEEAERRFREAEQHLRGARDEAARTAQAQMEHLLVRAKDTKELESVSGWITQIESRCAAIERHRDGLIGKTAELASRIEKDDRELADLERGLEESDARREDARVAREVAERERDRLREHREDLVRRRTSLESRLNLLREQRARHEGFDVGVRFLLERKGTVPGILGVVGDLLTPLPGVPEKLAEALLGDALQWVVVRDEAAAFSAIELLRAQGHGGVTFFPLRENTDRPEEAENRWGERAPIGGPPELEALVRTLLLRVRPAESRTGAREGARGGSSGHRHLTPEGEVFSSEGWIRISGGQGGDRGILDRMQEIPRLEQGCRQVEEEERMVGAELTAYIEEIAGLIETGRSLDRQRAELTDRHRRLERERSERNVERGLLLEEIERAGEDQRTHRDRLAQHRSERWALEERLGATGATEREADERFRGAKEAEEATGRSRDEALENLSGKRTEAIRLENDLREVENAAARDQEEVERLETALEQWGREREEASGLREDALRRRANLVERGGEIETHLEEAGRLLDRRRQERDGGQTELAAHEQEIRQLRTELSGLQERLHSDSVRELEIRSEMERLRERILQEFQVDLAEEVRRREPEGPARAGAEAAGPPPDEEQRRLEIAELREKLLKLGPVNFLAAEEYDRQKGRLLFHRRQREDLCKARQDLLDAIQRINETAGRMFRETFDLTRVRFQETFDALFPGGEADLILDGEDPLEGSIEIKARPRGKKLEAIRLLSTGERSLTAIALLFGIYLVKPSPFCILDELDAPLDDVNIGRFVNLLRHFSGRTQFVVITHNKRTMEAADRLYGVTMQEAGVSKIVSVQLSDADLELTPAAAELLRASAGQGEEV